VAIAMKRASAFDYPSKTMRGRERIWSSEQEFMVDASELSGEEGRGKLRKATGRSKHPLIRGSPNGVTRLEESPVTVH
jgi:hypothetical protein